MKILLLLFNLLIFSSCKDLFAPDKNNIKVAMFFDHIGPKQKESIEKKLGIKITNIKLDYQEDFIKQIKAAKPHIVFAPSYLNNQLVTKKLHNTINLDENFLEKMSQQVQKLYEESSPQPFKKSVVPLFMEDIKIFTNQGNYFNYPNINLLELFNNPQKKIVIHNNPQLISWIATSLYNPKFLPHVIANPEPEVLDEALKKFFATQAQKTFYSYDDAIKNWEDIDIFIGPNWINQYIKKPKKSYFVENHNLLTISSVLKTKYAWDQADNVINLLQDEYSESNIAQKYIPITFNEAKKQFHSLEEEVKKDMILANYLNYYYFVDHSNSVDDQLEFIREKIK